MPNYTELAATAYTVTEANIDSHQAFNQLYSRQAAHAVEENPCIDVRSAYIQAAETLNRQATSASPQPYITGDSVMSWAQEDYIPNPYNFLSTRPRKTLHNVTSHANDYLLKFAEAIYNSDLSPQDATKVAKTFMDYCGGWFKEDGVSKNIFLLTATEGQQE